MVAENTLREISKILYRLKRNYGQAMTIRIFDSGAYVVDNRTGREIVTYTEHNIKRGILLPENFGRSFSYDLSYIAANKNFTYGGFYDQGTRVIIIDRHDVPKGLDVNLDDELAFDNRRYTIKSVELAENNKGWLFTVTELTSEADIVPAATWTPAFIVTAGWYDFDDPTTLTTASIAISQIDDKSGNARHLIQPTAIKQFNVATFNGFGVGDTLNDLTYMHTSADATWLEATEFTVLMVVRQKTLTHTDDGIVGIPFTDGFKIDLHDNGGSLLRIILEGLGIGFSYTATTDLQMLEVSFNDGGTSMWIDGSVLGSSGILPFGSIDLSGPPGALENKQFNLNTGNTIDDGNDQLIGEIIVLTGSVTSANRELLEGYLAWKWGLQGNLPVSHPYKSAPPPVP